MPHLPATARRSVTAWLSSSQRSAVSASRLHGAGPRRHQGRRLGARRHRALLQPLRCADCPSLLRQARLPAGLRSLPPDAGAAAQQPGNKGCALLEEVWQGAGALRGRVRWQAHAQVGHVGAKVHAEPRGMMLWQGPALWALSPACLGKERQTIEVQVQQQAAALVQRDRAPPRADGPYGEAPACVPGEELQVEGSGPRGQLRQLAQGRGPMYHSSPSHKADPGLWKL